MNLCTRLGNYITRYAPSRQKVEEYLIKKGCKNIPQLLQECGYNEDLMIQMWMGTFLNTGKGKQEIYRKLLVKKFSKEIILKYLGTFEKDLEDWNFYEKTIEEFICKKLQKGKSLRIIGQELNQKFPYFKNEIRKQLYKFDDNASLKREMQKYALRYNIDDNKELQKFYQVLLRKGFLYQDIKNNLSIF